MEGLDIVAFCALPVAYRLVAHWAVLNRHRLLLMVAPPAADGERYGADATGLAAALPPDQDVLVTRRLRTSAAPIIAALAPDIIVSASFPQRIPSEIARIARFGAIDLHPTALPRGCASTSQRPVGEDDQCVAATVRRIVPEVDAGPVLAVRERRLPAAVAAEHVRAAFGQVVTAVLDEGVARAVAGDPRKPHGEARSAPAVPGVDAAWWSSWEESTWAIQRQAATVGLVVPAA